MAIALIGMGIALMVCSVMFYVALVVPNGGWRKMGMMRQARQVDPSWDELTPIERAWFHGVAFFSVVAVAMSIAGLVLLAMRSL